VWLFEWIRARVAEPRHKVAVDALVSQ
jgi:hypothetical protein